MPDDDLIEVVITAPDEAWLVAFTRRLIEQHLAAAGHHAAIRSVYTWDDEIHDQRETRVELHTRASHFAAIAAIASSDHPYEVPGVIAIPIVNASPAYRAWILAVTAAPGGDWAAGQAAP